MRNIDNIINEVIERTVGNMLVTEGVMDDIVALLKAYKKKAGKSKDDLKREKKLKNNLYKHKKHGKRKIRKKSHGGRVYYDYDDYEKSHRKVSKADSDSIKDLVDQDNTDIAAVAREVFPDHTPEGAQSQLRKILNGERPMTKDVAAKLEKFISRQKVAIK
jgi:hypothetical protein